MKVIYGLDTKSIEDASQCVMVEVPDYIEADEMDEYLDATTDEYGTTPDNALVQGVVGLVDVLDSMVLAMQAEGVSDSTIRTVRATVFDAVDNND